FRNGDKTQRGRVHTEAFPGWLGAIVKNVAEMRIAGFRASLGALHSKRGVAFLHYAVFRDWLGETGPARATVEFIQRAEERFAGDDIHINPGVVIVPVGVVKRRLCAALTCHVILVFG